MRNPVLFDIDVNMFKEFKAANIPGISIHYQDFSKAGT